MQGETANTIMVQTWQMVLGLTAIGAIGMAIIKGWINGVNSRLTRIEDKLTTKADESFVIEIKRNQELHDRQLTMLDTKVNRCKSCNA